MDSIDSDIFNPDIIECPKCKKITAIITGIKPVRIPPRFGGGWDTATVYDCDGCGEFDIL